MNTDNVRMDTVAVHEGEFEQLQSLFMGGETLTAKRVYISTESGDDLVLEGDGDAIEITRG